MYDQRRTGEGGPWPKPHDGFGRTKNKNERFWPERKRPQKNRRLSPGRSHMMDLDVLKMMINYDGLGRTNRPYDEPKTKHVLEIHKLLFDDRYNKQNKDIQSLVIVFPEVESIPWLGDGGSVHFF